MLQVIQIQSSITKESIEKLLDYHDEVGERLSKIEGLKGKYMKDLKDLLTSQVYISMKDIENRLGVSINTLTKIYSLLIENKFGEVKLIGKYKIIFNSHLFDIYNSK